MGEDRSSNSQDCRPGRQGAEGLEKLAEALAESEKKFRALFESTSDPVMLLDDTGFFDCNTATLKLYGLADRDEFCGRNPAQFSPALQPNGFDSDSLARQFIECAHDKGRCSFEWTHCRPDGFEFPCEVQLSTLDWEGRKAILAVVRDISHRHRMQNALKHSEQRLSLHIDETPLAYIEWNTDLQVQAWNQSAERIFGYSKEEALGRSALGLIVSEDEEAQIDHVVHDLLNRSGSVRSTNHNITKSGRTILCDWHNTPLVSDSGETVGIASLAQDVTQRRHAEEALLKSEQRRDLALEGADLGLWDWDIERGAAFFSPRCADMLGFDPDEFGSQIDSWQKRIHPEDRPGFVAAMDCHLSGQSPFFQSEHRLQTKSGGWRWIFARGKTVEWDDERNPRRVLGTFHDIGERKAAEDALRRKDRIMQAVAFAAEKFLGTGSWQDTIAEILERLGKATGVSRASILENRQKAGGGTDRSAASRVDLPPDHSAQERSANERALLRDGGSEPLGRDSPKRGSHSRQEERLLPGGARSLLQRRRLLHRGRACLRQRRVVGDDRFRRLQNRTGLVGGRARLSENGRRTLWIGHPARTGRRRPQARHGGDGYHQPGARARHRTGEPLRCRGRERQQGQERVSRQHEPRDPHAVERDHGYDGSFARYRPQSRTARFRPDGQEIESLPARGDQRYPRLHQDRGWKARSGRDQLRAQLGAR